MKIDLPALSSKIASSIDYNSTYPKTEDYWPRPINWSDVHFIEINSPKKVLMNNLTKPVSNIFKKIPIEVDFSRVKKDRLFKKYMPITTCKKDLDYSPIGLSTGLRHFIACNRPYWSWWDSKIVYVSPGYYEGYYIFSNNQIALHVTYRSSYKLLSTYEKLKSYISSEFWHIGNIYGFNRETERFKIKLTKTNKISLLMFLGAPCSDFYGTPETGYINGRFSGASADLWRALADQDKFTELNAFLDMLGDKLLDRIEALDILIDPDNLGDLAMSFSSHGLTFTIQGYKSWPNGPGYSYGYLVDTPNFGSPNQAFEMKIHGIAQVRRLVYNNTTFQYEYVYEPMSVDNLLTYIAVAYYVEDL